METQSKILVWYKVATQKIILGEARIPGTKTLTSLWLNTPTESEVFVNAGYGISLIGDDGREIADKAISMVTADMLLIDDSQARVVS